MGKMFDLESGIAETERRIALVERRPILVAVYGLPDSGKSFFIDRVGDHFKRRNLRCAKHTGSPIPLDFEIMKNTAGYTDSSIELCLFHCGWTGENLGTESYKKIFGEEDPALLAEQILGRNLDLSVLIYNPRRETPPEEVARRYDLIISNPGAERKIS